MSYSIAPWVTAAIAAVALLTQWLISWRKSVTQDAVIITRMDSFEDRIGAVEEELKEDRIIRDKAHSELVALIETRHERLQNDLRIQDQLLLGLIEEKGRNEARHEEARIVREENRKLLESIDRRLQALSG